VWVESEAAFSVSPNSKAKMFVVLPCWVMKQWLPFVAILVVLSRTLAFPIIDSRSHAILPKSSCGLTQHSYNLTSEQHYLFAATTFSDGQIIATCPFQQAKVPGFSYKLRSAVGEGPSSVFPWGECAMVQRTSCSPNARVEIMEDDGYLTIRAIGTVATGDALYVKGGNECVSATHNNLVVQKPACPPVEVLSSPTHGRGVFATRDIAEGEEIEVCPAIMHPEGSAGLDDYVWEWDSGSAILMGTCSLVNHGCEEANADITTSKGQALIMTATRDIESGEELLWDYGSGSWCHREQRLPPGTDCNCFH